MKSNAVVLVTIYICCSFSSFTNSNSITKHINNKSLIFPLIEQPYRPEIVETLPTINPIKYEGNAEHTDDTTDTPSTERDWQDVKIYKTVLESKPTKIIHSTRNKNTNLTAQNIGTLTPNDSKVLFLSNGSLAIPIDITSTSWSGPTSVGDKENPKFVMKEQLKKKNVVYSSEEIGFRDAERSLEDFSLTQEEDEKRVKAAEDHFAIEDKVVALNKEKVRLFGEIQEILNMIVPQSLKVKKGKEFILKMKAMLKKYSRVGHGRKYRKLKEKALKAIQEEIKNWKDKAEDLSAGNNEMITPNSVNAMIRQCRRNLA